MAEVSCSSTSIVGYRSKTRTCGMDERPRASASMGTSDTLQPTWRARRSVPVYRAVRGGHWTQGAWFC